MTRYFLVETHSLRMADLCTWLVANGYYYRQLDSTGINVPQLEDEARNQGIEELDKILEAVVGLRDSSLTGGYFSEAAMLTHALWWLNSMRPCHRCGRAVATRRIREICSKCSDIMVCQDCFDTHHQEIDVL